MSTNTSDFLINESSLPTDMFYNLKKSVMTSRSYRVNISPFNGFTFQPGTLSQFYVPGRKKCFLNTSKASLKYTLVNNSTSTTADAENYSFDYNAYSPINKWETYHGSNLLESIQQANVLCNCLFDLQTSTGIRTGLSASFGCAGDGSRKGMTITNSGSATVKNNLTVQVPILSSIIGTLNPKYLNLNISDDLRVEITWASLAEGMVLNSSGTYGQGWQITDVQLILDIVELSDEGMALFNSVSPQGSPQITCTNQYRHFVANIPGTYSGMNSALIGAKFASTKAIIVAPRRSDITNGTYAINSYCNSSRINPNFSQYQFKLGGLYIPARPVMLESTTNFGYAETFIETMKAYHIFADFGQNSGIGELYYNVVDNTTNLSGVNTSATNLNGGVVACSAADTAANGAKSYAHGFLICQDFESITNKNELILSGIDTRFSQLYFEYTINRPIGANAYILDFYVMHDALLVLDNGFYSIKF